MKLTNIIALSTAAILSLASCEMKNELTGSLVDKQDMGSVELGISVKQPVSQTRAEETVATNNFPVTIQGTSAETADVLKEYATLDEVPSTISVPVGNYTVSSHTPGELQKKMENPYYAGSTDITVSKGITSEVNVVCRMANSRIQMKYGDDFKAAFSTWTITVDDGTETALSYTESDLNPAPVYWYFGDDITSITVNIRAVTVQGNSVSERRVFKKEDAADKYEEVGDAFTGGDALEINMGTVESSTGELTGIDITTNITFEDESESVEIPTTDPDEGDGGDEGQEPGGDPEPPTGGDASITCIGKINTDSDSEGNVFETGVEYSISAQNWPETNVLITTPEGLKSLKITIIGGNEGFQEICDEIGFQDYELIGEGGSALASLLSKMGISLPMPEEDCTSYTFPVGQFYSMMNLYGATLNTDEDIPYGNDYHDFQMTIEDNAGTVVGPVSLKVTIKK